jgi:hypothetical protein
VTICEKGINPEARFDILKQDVTKMTELENALSELNALIKEANEMKKEGEELPLEELDTAEDEIELQAAPEEELPLGSTDEEMQYSDNELKEETTDGATQVGEAGEIVHDGTPRNTNDQITVVKSVWETAPTLDLSPENLEKAYVEYKSEQLEKLAYSNVLKTMEKRLDVEIEAQTAHIAKTNYNAKGEVDELKQQFSDLLKSLKDERTDVITKQVEAVESLQIPSGDEIAKMDWNELHNVVSRLEGN